MMAVLEGCQSHMAQLLILSKLHVSDKVWKDIHGQMMTVVLSGWEIKILVLFFLKCFHVF